MIRKIKAVSLALCLALVVTACSDSRVPEAPKEEKITLEMWKFKSAMEDHILYDWIDRWNEAHETVQVNLTLIPFNEYLSTKLPTAFATNSAPDIYMISAGSFMKYAKAGCMMPLDPYIDEALKRDFYGPNIATVTHDGAMLGMPIEREPVALFYNKALFEEKAIEPPKHWQDLLVALEALHSDDIAGIYMPIQPNDYQNFIFYSFLMQVKGDAVKEEGMQAGTTLPATEALSLWRKLTAFSYKNQALVQSPSDITALATGKVAMQISGYWGINMLEGFYPDFDYGVVPLPYPEEGINRSVYGGWYQIVNPGSDHAKEAAEFTAWMWGEGNENIQDWYREASKFPVRKSLFEQMYGETFNVGNNRIFAKDILPYAIPEPAYDTDINNAISRALQDAMFTDKKIPLIAEELDKKIGRYREDY